MMLKLLFIVYDLSKEGGNSLQALNLAGQISSMGHKVIIITSKFNTHIIQFLTNHNIRLYFFSKKNKESLNSLSKQIEFLKLIKFVASKEKIDLIQLFDPISTGFIGLYSMIQFRRPTVIRLGTIFEKFYVGKMENRQKKSIKNFIKKILAEKILRFYCIFILFNCKAIISNSTFIEKHYRSYINQNKMYIIHNGVEIESFLKNNDKLELSDYALYVGRIEPRKNINMIIKAYSKLPIKLRPNYLFLIGNYNFDIEYTEVLKRLAKNLGLAQNVIFKGFLYQKDLWEYYKNARYTIFSSNNRFFPMTEGLPNVVLEAMASGAVIIASNVAGVNEIINNGENGFLYNPNSINELIELLSMLDNAKENYIKMIQNNAIKFIQENFNFKLISKKYLKIYNNIVKKE